MRLRKASDASVFLSTVALLRFFGGVATEVFIVDWIYAFGVSPDLSDPSSAAARTLTGTR